MNAMTTINDDDINAYVDSLLPAARRLEVEAFLAAHPEAMARVRAYRAQNAALKAMFAPVLAEPVPEALRAAAGASDARRRTLFGWLPRGSLQRVAAAFALVVLGAFAGWFAHDGFGAAEHLAQRVPLSRQAAVAHAVFSPDVRRPVEVGADNEEQLVAWLSKRLGTAVRPPRLGGLGFDLIGGRLLPGDSGPVAQFMYQDGSGRRMTLYVSTDNAVSGETAFRFAQEGEVSVFYWIDGRFGYALSAAIDKAELARVATVVYDQIERARK